MNVQRPDALVFDLDGTLWDAAAASAEGWNLALDELGSLSRVTVDDIRSVSGAPFARCVEVLLPEFGRPDPLLLRSLEARERAAIERSGGALYDGVHTGLRRLALSYSLFLVSNCPDWYLEAFLRTSGLRKLFSGWDCHGASGLPKMTMLQHLARKHGWQAAVYLGDTQSDREAAEGAGLTFVYAGYGFGDLGEDPRGTGDGGESGGPVIAVRCFTEFVARYSRDTD